MAEAIIGAERGTDPQEHSKVVCQLRLLHGKARLLCCVNSVRTCYCT